MLRSHVSASVYACERCGWAHLCGDACTERFVDVATALPVCPITALCFGRMVTPWEEACEADARGGARADDEAADQQEEFGAAGGGRGTACKYINYTQTYSLE